MTNHDNTCRGTHTPWTIVRERLFQGQTPNIIAFSAKHGLDATEVFKLFAGEVISFSLKICSALSNETGMSRDFFRNLSSRWPPHPPPATSVALDRGHFFFYMCGQRTWVQLPMSFSFPEHLIQLLVSIAGGLGLEPRYSGPKPDVLPLDDPPKIILNH